MKLVTNLSGRLRNTSLPYKNGLSPLYEAVINSIHSIEDEHKKPSDGEITIRIHRDTQGDLGLTTSENKSNGLFESQDDDTNEKHIKSFSVIDNGVGFDEKNMESFSTLDSPYKLDKGARGIGRLLWLKAFDRVEVKSVYLNSEGERKLRVFTFSSRGEIKDTDKETPSTDIKTTTIKLLGFKKKYRENTYKSTRSIAKNLLEHCLWYFVRNGGAPKIIIIDDNNDDEIDLTKMFEEHMISSSRSEEISLKDHKFYLTHVKLRVGSKLNHSMALCADNRLVTEEKLTGKIPCLYGAINDGNSDFSYMCYVASKYLDKCVRQERTDFDFIENNNGLYSNEELSKQEIMDAIIQRSTSYLSKYLESNKSKSIERITNFINHNAPRYRTVYSRMSQENILVDPEMPDKDLELVLHKELAEIERELISEGHDIMAPKDNETVSDYKERLQAYLTKAEDIKKSDLVNYVFHRKLILDLLEKAIKKDDKGNFSREEYIHSLIMPLRKESNQILSDEANLWLIDERLAFHNYLASDKTLKSMPITNRNDTVEPDLIALNVFDKPFLVSEGENLPLASIVVIEIKRPMRDDARQGEKKDPIEQSLGYLDRIRKGKVKTESGRPIPNSSNIPGYCYVLCDLTNSMKQRCKMHDAIETSDGMGYFFYKKSFNAYVEVISFDKLVNSAKERNRAFFDKLGLPTN